MIISDLKNIKLKKDDYIVNANLCKNNCIGCFSCWIKHPKKCVFKDKYSNLVDILGKSEELIIISKNRYGCYSNNVKRVIERLISYVLPYFRIKEKMIRHVPRYNNKLKITTLFYGNIDNNDKKILTGLVKANSINLNALNFSINFFSNIEELKKYVYTN